MRASVRASVSEGRGRHDAVDEADAMRFDGGNLLARQQQLQRATSADEARQALRGGVAGDQPEVDLRLPEPGRVRSDPQRARHRQLAAAAERVAVDGGDHGLAHLLDEIEHVLAAPGVIAAAVGRQRRQLVDVGAGDKRLVARAGQDDGAHGRVVAAASSAARRSSSSVCEFSALSTFGRLMVMTIADGAVTLYVSRFSKAITSRSMETEPSASRAHATATNPAAHHRAPTSCSRRSSRISTANTSDTKNARSTMEPEVTSHFFADGFAPPLPCTLAQQQAEGPATFMAKRLAPRGDVERVEDDEKVQQTGGHQERVAVLEGDASVTVPRHPRPPNAATIRGKPTPRSAIAPRNDERVVPLERKQPSLRATARSRTSAGTDEEHKALVATLLKQVSGARNQPREHADGDGKTDPGSEWGGA